MPQVNQKVRTGNRIVVVLDGKQVGLIQSVRMSDDYSPEPASGVGDIHTIEHVPTRASHTLSVSAMALNRGSMRSAGVTGENGDSVLQGLVFDIEVYDKDTGVQLRKYVGCTYASGDIDISKHAIVMTSATFLALDVVGTSI